MMWLHKSLAWIVVCLLPMRVGARMITKIPKPLHGLSKWEHWAGRASHYGLYGLMTVLPATGFTMGYYGGKGIPLFFMHVKGAENPDGSIAKTAFKVHKLAGTVFTYLVPVHVGAAFLHVFRGQKIFQRINPFL